jgi:SAM-dependent methyltransferase
MTGDSKMSLIDRSPFLSGLNYAKGQVLTRLKLRGHFSGSTGLHMSVEEAADYASRVVADYITYAAGGDAERLKGKDVLEIGPGDNLGVAFLLLAKGARTVTCIDGFAPSHNDEHNSHIYRAIYNSLSEEERVRVQDVVALQSSETASLVGDRLISRYGVRMDLAALPLEAQSYDIVISRAVLEHLGNLEAGWRNMVRCLRPEGEMWHKVDFRCHTLFEQIHPLYFLTVPDPLWEMISQPDPTLNRLRLPTYRELAARDFRESRCYITHIAGESEFSPHVDTLIPGTHYTQRHLELISKIRPRLQPTFSNYSDEELLVTGVFLTLRGVCTSQNSH